MPIIFVNVHEVEVSFSHWNTFRSRNPYSTECDISGHRKYDWCTQKTEPLSNPLAGSIRAFPIGIISVLELPKDHPSNRNRTLVLMCLEHFFLEAQIFYTHPCHGNTIDRWSHSLIVIAIYKAI